MVALQRIAVIPERFPIIRHNARGANRRSYEKGKTMRERLQTRQTDVSQAARRRGGQMSKGSQTKQRPHHRGLKIHHLKPAQRADLREKEKMDNGVVTGTTRMEKRPGEESEHRKERKSAAS